MNQLLPNQADGSPAVANTPNGEDQRSKVMTEKGGPGNGRRKSVKLDPHQTVTPVVARRSSALQARRESVPTGGPARSASVSVINSGGTSRVAASNSPYSSSGPLPGHQSVVMGKVQEHHWIPDDMAVTCCVCRVEFSMYRRRHHCRFCGRVVCDSCSSNRIRGERACTPCWDRLGRKMSGLKLSDRGAGLSTTPGVRRSALMELLREDRYNMEARMEDGRRVSYSIAGVRDGLPVFVFLGLDGHRHSAAQFEDPARRKGLRLITIDRPGRGKSDLPTRSQLGDKLGSSLAGGNGGATTEIPEVALVVDTVKQVCSQLKIDKAGVMGQSLGAEFALACARDADLARVLEGTILCLVSPWVNLAAPGVNKTLQGLSQLPKELKGTVGKVGGEMVPKMMGGFAGKSITAGASETEQGYLDAPYSQELMKHVSEIQEGKANISREAVFALHNEGEEVARARLANVLHPVNIWHGRSDSLVPWSAIQWMERCLPSCATEIKLGGTHSLIFDKGEMEAVFSTLQRGVKDAKEQARLSNLTLSSSISYVKSVFNPTGTGTASSPRKEGSSLGSSDGAALATAAAAGGAGGEANRTSKAQGLVRSSIFEPLSPASGLGGGGGKGGAGTGSLSVSGRAAPSLQGTPQTPVQGEAARARGLEEGDKEDIFEGIKRGVDRALQGLSRGGSTHGLNSSHGSAFGLGGSSGHGTGSAHGSALGFGSGHGGVGLGNSSFHSIGGSGHGSVSSRSGWWKEETSSMGRSLRSKGKGEEEGDVVAGGGGEVEDDFKEGFKRGLEKMMSSLGGGGGGRDPNSMRCIEEVGVSPQLTGDRASAGTSSNNGGESGRGLYWREGAGGGGGALSAAAEAAAVNWPAGRVPGEPALDVWSPEKAVVCHVFVAGFLSTMVVMW